MPSFYGRSYGRSGYSPSQRSHERLIDIIMRNGEMSAQDALRRGDILAGTLQDLGNRAQGHLDRQEQERKQAMEVRRIGAQDAAATRAIMEWDGQDAQGLLGNLVRIKGPGEGPKLAQAVMSFRALNDKADERNVQNLKTAGGALAGMSYEMFEKLYPGLQEKAPEIERLMGVKLPPEPSPEIHEYVRSLFGVAAKTREIKRRLPDGSEEISIVEDKPGFSTTSAPEQPKAPNLQTVETAEGIRTFNPQTGEMGPVIGRPKPPAGRSDDRLVQVQGPDGKATWEWESKAAGRPAAQAARAVTGQERTALGFYNRAKRAFEDADKVADKLGTSSLDKARMAYEGPGSNIAKSPEMQAYRQAQRAYTEARLRKESGAAIPEHEIEADAKTYFWQLGDSPEVKAQKDAARAEVLAGMAFGAGQAYDEYYGEPFQTPRLRGSARAGAPPPKAADKKRSNPFRR